MTDIAIAISVSKKHMMIYFVFSNYHQCCSSKLSKSLPKVDCYEPNIFFFFFIDRTAEDLDRKKGEREGERHAAKGLRPGVELGSAAARTKSLYMEACTTEPHEQNILKL